MAKPRKEILVVKEYGWLTVLGEAPKDSSGHIRWRVRCRCGKEYDVLTGFLSKKEPKCRNCYESLTKGPLYGTRLSKPGDVINGWEILEEVGKNKYGGILYRCRCPVCGTESIHTRGELIMRKGNGCQQCKPDYQFAVFGNSAIGVLEDGTKFTVDASITEAVGLYHWHLNGKGYIQRGDRNLPKMMLHWFVLGYDAMHSEHIDHINRDRTDCRTENLRIVTAQQNSMNRSIQSNNTSGYVGVCFHKKKNKFMASIGLNNKKITLGFSDDPVYCAQLYNYASELLFREFAGHRNDVPDADGDAKLRVEKKLHPYRTASMIATMPIMVQASA